MFLFFWNIINNSVCSRMWFNSNRFKHLKKQEINIKITFYKIFVR